MTITTHINDNGDLVLQADSETQQDLLEEKDYHYRMNIILEELHEQYDWIEPSVIGALTDAPILINSDDYCVSNNHDYNIYEDAKVYYFANYAIEDETETLASGEPVTFRKV